MMPSAWTTAQTFQDQAVYQSTLESIVNVPLAAEIDGRIVAMPMREGQMVRPGDPLFRLDQIQQQSTVAADTAEARKDRLNAERYIFLNQQGAVSTKDRDAYVARAISSGDQVRAAAATLGYKYVTAPISGEIGDLDTVKLGDYVRKGEAITGIVDNANLWTLMDVPATQSARVRLGQPVQLVSQGNPPVTGTGKVVFISPYYGVSGNSSSPNTVLVKASFPNLTGLLKPGQFVRNRIITGSDRQLSVPVQAVMMQAQQPFVYRVFRISQVEARIRSSTQISAEMKKPRLIAVMPETIVVQTPVQLGPLQANSYPVISGLRAGDQVVVSNTALLRTGLPVKVVASQGADGLGAN